MPGKPNRQSDLADVYGLKIINELGIIVQLADNSELFNADALIDEALKNVYTDTNIMAGVDPNLFNIHRKSLHQAIESGFGAVDYNSPDYLFINELKSNADVFSAFASYKETKQMKDLLINTEGKLKTFSKFKKDAKKVTAINNNYIRTEYNTAVKRARTAAQFKEFQETADLYPNITWTLSRAAHPDSLHRSFYGTTLPINDEFWSANFPGNRWNCKCGWEASDGDIKQPPKDKKDKHSAEPGLDKNPAKDAEIFTKTHPYYKVPKKGGKAVDKEAEALQFKYTRKDVIEWSKQNVPADTGITFKANTKTKELTLLRSGVKKIVSTARDIDTMLYVHEMHEDKSKWEYLGKSLPVGNKHLDAEYFNYYKIKINGKDKYVNTFYKPEIKKEVVYAIYESIDLSKIDEK